MLETLLPGAQRLQNVHPLLVHFPLALLPASALAYVLAWLAGRDAWAWTGLWLLVLGAVSAAAAATTTGLRADEGVMVDPSVREQLLDPHRRLMLTTVGLSIALAAWAAAARPLPARGRGVFLILLVVLLALMSRGADYGGRMVYDYNAGGNACPQPIEFTR
ncbi:MAG: DUF2231 domain-containing protein [Deltaproteobacteria bacterium]|nr:MAG: DUF2231 domain-containing protein [Deltaproteobacteria bacterium]